jgi:methyl-accepting chemotaxis protein
MPVKEAVMESLKNSLKGQFTALSALVSVAIVLINFGLQDSHESLNNAAAVIVAAVLVGVGIYYFLMVNVEGSIRTLAGDLEQFKNGDLEREFALGGSGDFSHIASVLRDAQTNFKASIDEQSHLLNESELIRHALDVCDTSVMLADENLNIIYTNHAVIEMLRKREVAIRTHLPGFSSSEIMGKCVDDFHKNPAHQRGMLKNLVQPHNTNLNIAGLTFNLIATPLYGKDQKRLGTVVEWKDITEQLAKEKLESVSAAENLRIKQALDVCDTSVMLADEELNIIYMNKAVSRMMGDRETQIKTQLPNFSAQELIGVCVDDFHKDPSHQRSMLKELRDAYTTDLKLAGLTFGLIATPLFDDKNVRLGTVVEWSDKTERLAQEQLAKTAADENSRIRQALDTVATNTMIADGDFNIIYMNKAIHGMMQVAEGDIKRDLPGFNANSLMGANIDVFHKNPSHQRSLVGAMKTTFRSDIEVGGRSFNLIANPITSPDGERIGTVVEWSDRTDEVAIEKEIDTLVEAAGRGDFSQLISLEGKSGFFKTLSEGLNELMTTTEVGINDVLRILGALAKGNLMEKITREYEGAFGQLKRDANGTAEKLTEIIGSIRHSSAMIGTAANEIAQGNADLSQRTEEQASSLEETASSMEEMTSTVKQSAENAKHANELAKEAQEKASQGGEVVDRAVRAMDEINTSSKRIADIIGVIDEIAFQTNLLALNAAVEAARAGEQGRGFAVVAGEVRNLAQRSAAAAKEIKDLIRDSVSKVEDGSQLVNESGSTLRDIVGAVERVSEMMREIADAAQEQTSGIEQVNTAVAQMDEMTQQNAALVEQASAAGEAMAEQAGTLNSMMDFFSIENMSADEIRRPSLAPPRQSPVATNYVSNSAGALPGGKGVSLDDDEWEEF